jgi:hypothetical protein
MSHACINIVGDNVSVTDKYLDSTGNEICCITYPLAKIAERLGVQGISDGEKLPKGYWVCDGTHGGKAYNWFELVDKMTGKIFGNLLPCCCEASPYIVNGSLSIKVHPDCPKHGNKKE